MKLIIIGIIRYLYMAITAIPVFILVIFYEIGGGDCQKILQKWLNPVLFKKQKGFKMYNTEQELALMKKEIELIRRDELLKIREEIDLAKQALVADWSKIEHDYHSALQAKQTEIARLDALIEAKKAIMEQDNATGQFLKEIIVNLSKMHTPNK